MMNPNYIKLSFPFCFAILLLMSGCDGEEEAIPAFIEILPFEITTDYGLEGSASHKVVDAWLNVGTDFLGAYELPATVPVLAEGNQLITIFPGIKVNGFASRAEINDFYNRFETTVDLTPGAITTIQPTTTYRDNAVFPFIENFDNSHLIDDDEDGNEDNSIVIELENGFESGSGHIRLDADNPIFEAATNVRIENLPINGRPVFLELDYKNDVQFAIGLIGHQVNVSSAKQYFIVLNEKEDWNKIYLDLTGELTASGFTEYQVVIQAILPRNETGEFDRQEGNVFLDNLKLVHFDQ